MIYRIRINSGYIKFYYAPKDTDIQTRNDFNQVLGIFNFHRQRVSKAVDDESLRMIWEGEAYVSQKLESSELGANVVRQLSEYINLYLRKGNLARKWLFPFGK